MSTRAAVAVGLLLGAFTAALVLVAMVAFGPPPVAPGPTPIVPSLVPTPAGPGPADPTPAASTAPSGSPGPAPSSTVTAGNFHVGEEAPPLSVAQLGGGTVDLAALRGQPVWVNFMATWCPQCVDEFPRMSSFAARYADEGLVVVAVDVREDEATVAPFVQRLDPTFPIGLDLDGEAQEAWGAYALPVHFWIDREGVVRYGSFGGIGPDIMAEALRTILPGVEVTP
jgi:thiol-disulfide isomerase/thioredoxin